VGEKDRSIEERRTDRIIGGGQGASPVNTADSYLALGGWPVPRDGSFLRGPTKEEDEGKKGQKSRWVVHPESWNIHRNGLRAIVRSFSRGVRNPHG